MLVLLFDSFALLLVLSVFTLLVVLFVTLFAKFEFVLEVELEISLFVCALLVSFSFSSTLFPIDVLALWLFELLPSTKLAILSALNLLSCTSLFRDLLYIRSANTIIANVKTPIPLYIITLSKPFSDFLILEFFLI